MKRSESEAFQMKQTMSFFEGISQFGLGLTLLTAVLTVIKPFFPDGWVELMAQWIQQDFDTLAQWAVQGLAVLGLVGLSACLLSLLIQD